MNDRYFVCLDCKIYIDAGYRWAYSTLEEPGIIERGKSVKVADVQAAQAYWNPPQEESNRWLYDEVFPSTRRFLEAHRDHHLIYGEREDFIPNDEAGFLDWMQIGFSPVELPRYFMVYHGFTSWKQVESYIEKMEEADRPWWWKLEWQDTHNRARQKFEALVSPKKAEK